jgi:pyridoxamine 5'-phosphate oxidase
MSFRSKLNTLKTLGQGVIQGLPDATDDRDPIELFGEWYRAAEEAGLFLHETTALATATPEGIPSVRMVLLKKWDEHGFVFFTNYDSRKALELEANPHAALLMHWGVLERQVRIEGTVERISEEESSEYFKTRTRGSQLGAWASKQSERLASRDALAARLKARTEEFDGGEIPLPPFWGGYRVMATRLEFWQGRANRLHERLVFVRAAPGWTTERLYP